MRPTSIQSSRVLLSRHGGRRPRQRAAGQQKQTASDVRHDDDHDDKDNDDSVDKLSAINSYGPAFDICLRRSVAGMLFSPLFVSWLLHFA